MLGVDGISDFAALYSRRHDHEVQFYTFDMLAGDGDDMRGLPLSLRKPTLPGCSPVVAMAFSLRHSSKARSVPTYSGRPATWRLRDWYRSGATDHTGPGGRRIG